MAISVFPSYAFSSGGQATDMRLYSSTDRASVSGTENGGSIPPRVT